MKDKEDQHVILSLKCPFLRIFWIYLKAVNVLKTNTHRRLRISVWSLSAAKAHSSFTLKHGLAKIPSLI